MIKAIVFDFFGVICSDEYWNYVRADRHAKGVFRDYMNQVNTGGIHWNDFVRKIADATHTSPEEVMSLYKTERIDPRMVDWIADLHEQFKIGLITNAHHEFIDPLLAETHLVRHLDAVTVSSKVGVTKPHPAIFQHCINELGVHPHEVVFMDDLERYVTAAKELGMQAFQFRSFEQAKSDLQALLTQE